MFFLPSIFKVGAKIKFKKNENVEHTKNCILNMYTGLNIIKTYEFFNGN